MRPIVTAKNKLHFTAVRTIRPANQNLHDAREVVDDHEMGAEHAGAGNHGEGTSAARMVRDIEKHVAEVAAEPQRDQL